MEQKEEDEEVYDEEQLKSYREELLRIFEKSNDAFEKQLSYISAGGLGVTFILIEKIFKDIFETKLKGLLILSWIMLALTLLINLLSHVFSSKMQYLTISDIDDGEFDADLADKRTGKIIWFNITSIAFLIIGILTFVIYTSFNVLNMKNGTRHQNNNEIIINPPVVMPSPGTGSPASPAPKPVKPTKL